MLLRELGRSGLEVSVLGFGCMRLPIVGGESAVDLFDPSKPIEESEAADMIHYAIDHGVNYFDTAFPYHGGQSEPFLGKILKPHRDKIMLATKLPTWLAEKPDDFGNFLDQQLKLLNTDYIDCYLLHGLNRPLWSMMQEFDALSFLDKAIDSGKIRYAGFSFHDDVNIFKEIVDSYDWTMCLIQYNYFDEDYQAGREGLEYAGEKGMGVVVMEPLRGGKLVDRIPEEIQAVWDSAEVKRSPVEWALKWVWNQPEVSCALSGMSSMAQVEENIRIARDGRPGSLTEGELDLIARATEKYREMLKVDCTGCAYCIPCPNGVDIPLNLSLYNDTFMFKDADINEMIYNHMMAPEQRASNCQECGECEEHCPQQLDIIGELKNTHARLSAG